MLTNRREDIQHKALARRKLIERNMFLEQGHLKGMRNLLPTELKFLAVNSQGFTITIVLLLVTTIPALATTNQQLLTEFPDLSLHQLLVDHQEQQVEF